MKVSDYIADFFHSKGIDVIFGYQGGMITHLVDSIARHPRLRFVQVYHEQSGAIAAEGYARTKGLPGVCISTSGPGATNMITGIADAYFDSIPVIFITGQVNTYEYKYERLVRQLGFQETDVVSIVQPITKYSVMVEEPAQIRYALEQAWYMALEGRPGPVLLDIPMNVFRADADPAVLRPYPMPDASETRPDVATVEQAAEMIRNARRPMFLLGGGVIGSGAATIARDLIRRTHIPYVCSLMGKSAVDETLDEWMGMLGSYGNRMANMSVFQADVLVVLGSRLDTRQTGPRYESFLKSGYIIHVDIDPGELEEHRMVQNRLKIRSDVKPFLIQLTKRLCCFFADKAWRDYCNRLKTQYNQRLEVARFVENKAPYQLMETLNRYTQPGDIVAADVGQNQMWAAQMILIKPGMRFLTSGGLAPMGYALPAAVGAVFGSSRNRKAWVIAGDGGLHISSQSLLLVSQYRLPLTVIVINNASLGMITQFQELYFDGLFAGTDREGGYWIPHFEQLAAAYDLPYYRLTASDLDNVELMNRIMAEQHCLVEYLTEGKTKVSPKLEYDKPFNRPSPLLPLDEQQAADDL